MIKYCNISTDTFGKDHGPSFDHFLNSFHPRVICTKFHWYWVAGSGEEDFSIQIWLSLLWPLPTPENLDLYKIYLISESFHVNMSSSSSVVLERKKIKWPHPIFAFCNYLSFEEDIALNLNNLEFPLPKEYLYQVWLKLACWFWRRRNFKIFSVHFYSFAIIPH
jgi:hypothetical protein